MILSLRNRPLAIHVTLDSCPLVSERGKGTSVRERLGGRGNGNLGWGLVFALRWHEKAQNCFDEARWWLNYDMVQILYDARHYPTSTLLSGITYFVWAWFLLLYALKAPYTYIYSCSYHATLNATHPSILQYICVSLMGWTLCKVLKAYRWCIHLFLPLEWEFHNLLYSCLYSWGLSQALVHNRHSGDGSVRWLRACQVLCKLLKS